MNFGMIPYDKLTVADVGLPDVFIPTGLSGYAVDNPKIYVGLTKWNDKTWKGNLYPDKVKDAEALFFYAKNFNSIELNATHYNIYTHSVISKWRNMVGDADFLFCPKFVNKISHFGPPDPQTKKEATDAFLASIYEFKDKLGPAFILFPDHFNKKSYSVVLQYLKSLPTDIEVFVEFRNESWFNDKLFFDEWVSELKSLNKGVVITDSPGRRDVLHMQLSTNTAFVRFVCNGINEIDQFRIHKWKEQLRFWYANGLHQCFFFLHIHNEQQLVDFARWVQAELNSSLENTGHV